MGDWPSRWAPRVLAPLAFFAAAGILIVLVQSALDAETGGSNPPAVTGTRGPGATGSAGTETQGPLEKRFYRIREGDTLEAVALRFDTTVDDLLALNPAIEPNSLTPGQRIRIR